jgi:glycoside/pentoside/hexuronide:cation symporter, GPH family
MNNARFPPAGQPLSRRTKFIYSLGDWGTSSATVARNTFWFIFLTNVVGLGAGLAGTVVLVGRIWDSINDPLIGTLSDRVRTRWGRRRPFLLFGAVPFGLAFFLMFYVPPIDTTLGLAIYYCLVFLLFDTLYTLVNVPYIALMPELTEDFDERSNLAGWRMSSSILAALVTAGTFTLLAEDILGVWLGGDTAAIRSGYALTAALWGVVMSLPLLILFRYIKEPERAPDREPIRPLQTFREVFSNRPFRLAAIIYLLSFATMDVVLVVFIRFLIDYVQVTPGFDNLLLALVLSLAFLSMPVVVRLMHRYDKRTTYIGSMLMMAVVLLIIGQVPPGGQNWMLVAALFAGLGYGAANAVPWAIVADVIEVDELHSGKRREGVYAGYLVFFRKLASALAIFMVGQLLEASGFVSSTGGRLLVEQPESALLMLRLLVGVIPAFMLALAMLAAWRYPLSRARFNEIRQELLQQRAKRSLKMVA